MGIAFEYAPVHERAGIAFVRVTDDEFPISRRIVPGLPFYAGRETCSAASAQAGALYFIDDLLRLFSVNAFAAARYPFLLM
jgi:hypothetical protein